MWKGLQRSFSIQTILLPTASEGNVFRGVCQSFCSQSASWLLGHPCYSEDGTHPTGMLSCVNLFLIMFEFGSC